MVAYFETEADLDVALKQVKTPEQVSKIVRDLEQRMAPLHWVQKALHVFYGMC